MGAFLTLSTSVAVILLVNRGGLFVDIIGGHEVTPHSRPFMALINGANGNLICGGALIKENWVLTAAHCNVKGGKVILGAHSQKAKQKEKQVIRIAKEIRYRATIPSLRKTTLCCCRYRFYTSLIQYAYLTMYWFPPSLGGDKPLLQKRATRTKAVQPIPLPTSDDDPKPGTTYTVAGWGQAQNHPRRLSDTLREVNITVISRQICNNHKDYRNRPVITDDMICTEAKNGGKDSCSGDLAGPLRCNKVMRGITSFGKANKCGAADGPGVYSRLTKQYLQWIRETIGGA